MTTLTLTLPADVSIALRQLAAVDGLSREEAATMALRDWMVGHGYLDLEDAAETPRRKITAEEEFLASDVRRSIEDAPQDGTPIIGRDADGDVAYVRWRMGQDLESDGEEDPEPYWATWDGDQPFEPIVWVPTIKTISDMPDECG